MYCGLASAKASQKMIQTLIKQPDTLYLSGVLGEAFLSSNAELLQNRTLRVNVLKRIAVAPYGQVLRRFTVAEVQPIANSGLGCGVSTINVSEAFIWLRDHPREIDLNHLAHRIREWTKLTPEQVCEIQIFLHGWGHDKHLSTIAHDHNFYASPGPSFAGDHVATQAEIALIWLSKREDFGIAARQALLQALRVLTTYSEWNSWALSDIFPKLAVKPNLGSANTWRELLALTHKLTTSLEKLKKSGTKWFPPRLLSETSQSLQRWAHECEEKLREWEAQRSSSRKRSTNRTTKQSTKRRRK